jgi:peptidoglycan hydrolase-like protein with peptidoglycan-binding domain
MSITHTMTRVVAPVAGIALAVALIASAVATPKAQAALSSTQVSAIISLLQSFGADAATIANVQASLTGGTPSTPSTGGSGTACYAWTRSLTTGSTGDDVKALQMFLNSNAGTQVAASGAGSPGMESMYFGPATMAAVAKFQTANGITPAAGYFGPITRAAVAAKCSPSTPGSGTPSGPLSGGEGQLLINGSLGDVESDLDEGEDDVKVLGVEVEADDSDIALQRVDVDITVGSGGSSQLDNYIDDVSLWLGSTRLASLDVDEGDEDSNDVYSFRFTGLNGVIREGDEDSLYVAVTAVGNIDSSDTSVDLTVEVPENGIRAVDAAGISETYVGSGDALTETFTVGEATTGDLDISEGDNNPEGQVVTVDEDDDTLDVLVLAFDVEAGNQDVVIDAIPVGLTTDDALVGSSRVAGVVKRAILKRNGSTVDTVSIPSTATTSYTVLFEDLDIDLSDGDTDQYEVYVDLNNVDVSFPHTFATGTTLYATTSGSGAGGSLWDVEDAEGDSITPDGSVTNSGELLVFQTEGITVELVSTSQEKTSSIGTNVTKEIGEFKIVVDITAVGEDMYIDKSVTADPDRSGTGSAGTGFQWATTTDSTTGSSTAIAAVVTASGSTSGDSTNTFKINDGQTRRFTLTVSLEASIDGVTAVQLMGVNWDTADGASSANFFNSNLSDFKTDLLTLLVS